MRRANEGWRTLSFTPALPDTRGWWFESDGTPFYIPIIGWLVQERITWDHTYEAVDGDETPRSDLRDRRVLPAISRDDAVVDVVGEDSDTLFVHVLAPGEPLPTADELAQAWAEKESFARVAQKIAERARLAKLPPPAVAGERAN